MALQDDQTTIINSSIALLQKRFRELERMKIIRQERELMRMLLQQSQEKHRHQQKSLHHIHHYLHKKPRSKPKVQLIPHQPEIVELNPMPSIQLSLSLWPESEKKQAVFHLPNLDSPPLPSVTNSWLTDDDSKTCEEKRDVEDVSFSDVDTSLHL